MKRFVFFILLVGVLAVWVVNQRGQSAFKETLERCAKDYVDLDVRNCVFRYVDGLMHVRISDYLHTLARYNIPEDALGVYCHEIAAEVGKRAVLVGQLGAMQSCTDLCASGCYQGVLEGMYENGTFKESDLVKACDTLKDMSARMSCVHGYGHVLARLHEVDNSVVWDACSKLTPNDQAECGNAAFMQLYGSSPAEIVVKPPADLVPWCGTFPEVFQSDCYERVGNMAYHQESDLDRAARSCAQVPKASQIGCFTLLGRSYAVGFTAGPERQKKIEYYCQKYGSQYIEDCQNNVAI